MTKSVISMEEKASWFIFLSNCVIEKNNKTEERKW